MAYKVRFSAESLRDLDDIWADVLQVSQDLNTAEKYIDGILNQITAKKSFPESGIPLLYKGLFTGFFSVNYKAYKAFYRLNANHMEVVRVLPMAMDYMVLLFGESEGADGRDGQE